MGLNYKLWIPFYGIFRTFVFIYAFMLQQIEAKT